MPRASVPVDEAHRKSVGASIADIARFLQQSLGTKLVAYMTGAADPGLVGRWARGENVPRSNSESALRATYQVFKLLEKGDSAHIVRAWFIGMNPQLDGETPAEAVRSRQYREVWTAARAYAAGG